MFWLSLDVVLLVSILVLNASSALTDFADFPPLGAFEAFIISGALVLLAAFSSLLSAFTEFAPLPPQTGALREGLAPIEWERKYVQDAHVLEKE